MKNLIKKYNNHQIYGVSGVFPFLFIIFLCFLDETNFSKYIKATVFYLFLIICFIGATYWGIAINLKNKSRKLIISSITPTIFVFFLYFFKIDLIIQLLLGIIFINITFFFEKIYLKDYVPRWYLKLRKTLNFLVTISVLVIILIIFNYRGFF